MPDQRGGEKNRRYLIMHRCAAARGFHRERVEHFSAKVQGLVPRQHHNWLSTGASKLRGARIWFKKRDDL